MQNTQLIPFAAAPMHISIYKKDTLMCALLMSVQQLQETALFGAASVALPCSVSFLMEHN